eukprot:6642244-Ditylum_brightwellii.AAC.1
MNEYCTILQEACKLSAPDIRVCDDDITNWHFRPFDAPSDQCDDLHWSLQPSLSFISSPAVAMVGATQESTTPGFESSSAPPPMRPRDSSASSSEASSYVIPSNCWAAIHALTLRTQGAKP